jgi:hypothetical protein
MKIVIKLHSLRRHSVFIIVILFYSTLAFAQNDIYHSHPSFIPTIKLSINQPVFRNNMLFLQNNPLLSQYLPKKRDCFFLLASNTSICFNREINMEAMSKQTKLLFFKMKMWKYFR